MGKITSYFRENGRELLKKSGGVLLGILLTSAGKVVCRRYNVPISFDYDSDWDKDPEKSFYSDLVIVPRNPVETSILSIYKSTKHMAWDSDIIGAAKDICQIVDENNVSDETRSYAIMILSKISEDIKWSSSRQTINGLIMSITKGND